MGASQLLHISLRIHLHRGVIETPGRYSRLFPAAFLVLAVSLIPAQDIYGALRS